ncbi:MAG: DUF2155 domain-containing protein [Proteobacteria bacterium]|nr:DUF2155 domain-containing protein [Pseudomonadota bacterium]
MARTGRTLLAVLGLIACAATPALADKIKNPIAVFAGLDKITGRIISFEVAIDETVQFGSLQLTPRVCYTRPAYENPQTNIFVEVDEVTLNNEYKRLFTGWMFASSPGLSAVEHPVYDLWLTECKGGSEIIKVAPEKEELQPVMPLETKRTTPPKPVERRANTPAPPRAAPSQSFFPTNQPPPASGGGPRPLNLNPVGIDPARGNN